MVKLGIGVKSVVVVKADGLLLMVLLSIQVSLLQSIKPMFLLISVKINLVLGAQQLILVFPLACLLLVLLLHLCIAIGVKAQITIVQRIKKFTLILIPRSIGDYII